MARELLQKISRDEDERVRFRARRKFQMDMEHSLIAARDEGLSKGRSEGIISVAKNALQLGIAIDTIITLTGLTRDEIEGLRNVN